MGNITKIESVKSTGSKSGDYRPESVLPETERVTVFADKYFAGGPGTGGGDGGSMESRIVALEANAGHVKDSLLIIRGDLRKLLLGLIALGVGAVAVAGWIVNNTGSTIDSTTKRTEKLIESNNLLTVEKVSNLISQTQININQALMETQRKIDDAVVQFTNHEHVSHDPAKRSGVGD